MSHSLVAKLSGLKHKGFITESEYGRLRKGLNSLKVDEMYQLEMENAEEFIPKSVLDKIRAEIETIIGEHNLDDYDFCSGLICARKIIDKYRTESEDNNADSN